MPREQRSGTATYANVTYWAVAPVDRSGTGQVPGRDTDATGDPQLRALLAEVERYPTVRALPRHIDVPDGVVVPFRVRHPAGELAMFTTVTTFGTPADVTVAELALELFYPLDEATAQRLERLATA